MPETEAGTSTGGTNDRKKAGADEGDGQGERGV